MEVVFLPQCEVQQKSSMKSNAKKPILPPKVSFTGSKDNAVYLVATDVMDKERNALEYTKLQNHLGDKFKGADLTFIHSFVEWNPADIFTKEDKDTEHFMKVRSSILCDPALDSEDIIIRHGGTPDDSEIISSTQATQETGGCQVGSPPSLTCSTH